jgi:hypothetical protein
VPNEHVTVVVPLQVPCDEEADTNVTPAGKISVTMTPVALLGPLLVTVIVYVNVLPTTTGSGASVLEIDRSAAALTVVVVVELLLLMFGSVTLLVTLAVLLSVPTAAAVGVTTIVTVALAALANVPMEHVMVVVPLQFPNVDVADTNVTFAGNVSVTVTPVAELSPPFFTRMLYVRFCPANTGSGESLFLIERSAEGSPPLLVVELLVPAFGSLTLLDTVTVSCEAWDETIIPSWTMSTPTIAMTDLTMVDNMHPRPGSPRCDSMGIGWPEKHDDRRKADLRRSKKDGIWIDGSRRTKRASHFFRLLRPWACSGAIL